MKSQTSQVINTNQSTDSTTKDAGIDQPNQSTDQFVKSDESMDKSTAEIDQSTAADNAESAEINDESSVRRKTEMEMLFLKIQLISRIYLV